jgi:sulfur carrier protein
MANISLVVNGLEEHHRDGLSLAQLLQEKNLGSGRIAVEHNGDIVPKSQYGQLQLAHGDRLEIVQAIGGG